jgi:hypothetical protein
VWLVVVLVASVFVVGLLLGARLGSGPPGPDVRDALLRERVSQIRVLEGVIDRARLKANDLHYEFAQTEDAQRLPHVLEALDELVSDLTPLPTMGLGEEFMEFSSPLPEPPSGNGGV